MSDESTTVHDLRELVRGYGCSVVLCTATQPAVHDVDGLNSPEALIKDETREIMPEPDRLYTRLKRVEVEHVGGGGRSSVRL